MNRLRATPIVAAALVLAATLLLVSAAPAAPTALSYDVLDDFNRADEDPLSGGGDWAQTDSGTWPTPMRLVTNAARRGGNTSASYWTQDSFAGGTGSVWAKWGGIGDQSGVSIALYKDVGGASAVDGYELRREVAGIVENDYYILRRVDNGVRQNPALAGVENGPYVGYPYFNLRRVGSTVEAWASPDGASWTLVLSAQDSTYMTGTFYASIHSNSTGPVGQFLDDFGAAASAVPPGPPTGGSNGTTGSRGTLRKTGQRTRQDPVNTFTGFFVHQEQDLSTPGTGASFDWTRSYTSGDPTVGPLGPGWTHTYAASLQVQGNGDVLARGEEGQEVFYTRQANGSFVGDAGALATLISVAGGYELKRTDQVVYAFNASGRLLSVKDRNDQGVTLAYDGSGRLATVTDAAGNQTTVSYNAQDLVSQVSTVGGRSISYAYTSGRLTSFTDVRGKVWTYTYDAQGRLATIVDPLSHTQVTNVYDTNGRVTSQTDAVGKTATFAWDAATEVATITDANSKVWKDDYEQGVLAKEIDPLNNETLLSHDADLNETAVTSPTAQQTTMTYDAAGNLLTATAPPSLGSVQKTLAYNGRNDPTQTTDARGKITSYTYTPAGNTATITQDGTQVGSYTYDGSGRILTFTDGNGKTTTNTYFPGTGYLESVTDAVGNKTTYTYDAAGRVLTRVDPKGNCLGCTPANFTWSYTYNPAGQQLTETDPLGHTTTNAYDDAGRVTSMADANNHATSYAYDNANRVLIETAPDPDGGGPLTAPVTTYTYDNVGNKLTETDPRGNTTTFTYDSANRLASETGPDPDGAGPQAAPVTTYAYDANGSLASQVEPRGNVAGCGCAANYTTTYTYDAAGRLLTTTDPLGNVTTNTYDPVGNVVSVRDAKDHTTSYTYDAAGRVLGVTAPDLGVTTYGYDAVGNVLTRTDALNRTTTYTYDDASRLISETGPDPDGPGPGGPAVTTHSYDRNGNHLTTTDPKGNSTPTAGDGVTTSGYDRANRLTSVDYSDSTPDVTFTYDNVGNRLSMVDGSGTQTRTYDSLDRLVSVTRGSDTFSYVYDVASNIARRTYPGSVVADYTYDPLNRLATVASGGQTTTYAYDVASNLIQTTLPSSNGYVETRTYDRAGRMTDVESKKGTSTLAKFALSLDPVGNPSQVVRTGSLAQTQGYTYDASDRILSVCFQAGTCPGASDPFVRWTYDKVGNRLTEQRPGVATTSYSYDARDRLLSAGSTSYAYDQNGNELSAGGRTFTYDLANQLKTTTQGNTTTTYAYDGDGVRLQAATGTQNNKRMNFLWDLNAALPQIALERDGGNSLLRRYTYGATRISMASGNNTSYYIRDALGSSANLTSSSGATQWTWSYEPFGSVRTETKASGNQPDNFMKFTGEYLDPTGLYHLRARQYDPASGRFTRRDPIEPGPAEVHAAAYTYVGDRPVVLTDPSGEVAQPLFASIAGVDTVGLASSPAEVAFPIPSIRIPEELLCAARAGYPLARLGELNGGVAGHTYKHRNDSVHRWQNENAADYNVPFGTGVCAISSGHVSRNLGYGESSEGFRLHLVGGAEIAFYQHLSRLTVKSGQNVRKGQLLGLSGCGSEGVPHLHLALYPWNKAHNPERYARGLKPVSGRRCSR
jgi:RHS repeat-associated protein